MSRNDYAEALANGDIDAAVFCDPALTQVLKDERFQLFGGNMRDAALMAVGVIAARREMLPEGKSDVSRFVSILLEGIDAVRAADDQSLREKAGRFFDGIEKPKETLLARIAFLTLPENKKLFSSNAPGSFFTQWPDWMKFLEASGFYAPAKPQLSATDILDDSIVKSLQ